MLRVFHLPFVDSTQNEALRRAGTGEPLPFAVMADAQGAGRGRQGREWQSLPGNLLCTLAVSLPPATPPGDISFVVAVALYESIAPHLRTPDLLHLKWPNDVLLDGLKCAGVLLECPESDQMLIGIGLNIAHAPEGRAHLAPHLKAHLTPRDMLDSFWMAFEATFQHYQTDGLSPILARWIQHAKGIGDPITVRLPRETFIATFTGLAPDGALIATLPDGTARHVHAGEVFFG